MARVNKLVYRFDPDNTPKGRPHIFIYFITIDNQSAYDVTITGRRWLLHGRDKRIHVVEGDGVVGEKPRIRSGESFSFNSFHMVEDSVLAVGGFHGVDSEGRHILVRIPAFPLQLPGRQA